MFCVCLFEMMLNAAGSPNSSLKRAASQTSEMDSDGFLWPLVKRLPMSSFKCIKVKFNIS